MTISLQYFGEGKIIHAGGVDGDLFGLVPERVSYDPDDWDYLVTGANPGSGLTANSIYVGASNFWDPWGPGHREDIPAGEHPMVGIAWTCRRAKLVVQGRNAANWPALNVTPVLLGALQQEGIPCLIKLVGNFRDPITTGDNITFAGGNVNSSRHIVWDDSTNPPIAGGTGYSQYVIRDLILYGEGDYQVTSDTAWATKTLAPEWEGGSSSFPRTYDNIRIEKIHTYKSGESNKAQLTIRQDQGNGLLKLYDLWIDGVPNQHHWNIKPWGGAYDIRNVSGTPVHDHLIYNQDFNGPTWMVNCFNNIEGQNGQSAPGGNAYQFARRTVTYGACGTVVPDANGNQIVLIRCNAQTRTNYTGGADFTFEGIGPGGPVVMKDCQSWGAFTPITSSTNEGRACIGVIFAWETDPPINGGPKSCVYTHSSGLYEIATKGLIIDGFRVIAPSLANEPTLNLPPGETNRNWRWLIGVTACESIEVRDFSIEFDDPMIPDPVFITNRGQYNGIGTEYFGPYVNPPGGWAWNLETPGTGTPWLGSVSTYPGWGTAPRKFEHTVIRNGLPEETLVLSNAQIDVYDGSNPTTTLGARVAYSCDGNEHDWDDVGAVAMSQALFWRANLQHRIVHWEHSNHLGSNSNSQHNAMVISAESWLANFGIESSLVYDYFLNGAAASVNFAAAIEASSASDRLTIFQAGPWESMARAFDIADPAKHQFCDIISHSPTWNDVHQHLPAHRHRVAFYAQYNQGGSFEGFTPPTYVGIQDQNDFAFQTDGLSNWDWLNGDPTTAFVRARTEASGSSAWGDMSDSGMVFWWLTGNEEPTMQDIRDFFGL